MRFFSPLLALRIAKGIGMAAAGAAGGAGAHHFYSKSGKNETIPPAQAKVADPFSEGRSLGDEQIEMAKYLWQRDMKEELIDYEDRDSWLQQAKKYSLLSGQWPGDIIFIEDKSDASLARLLRDKCYSVSRWFLNKNDQTLNDTNPHLKGQFKNVKDSFKLDDLKNLCSTGKKDEKNYSIISANPRGLGTLLSEHKIYTYSCEGSTVPKGGWMEEIYNLKKDRTTGDPNACTIVKGNIIVEITYQNNSKKYEIRKSQIKDVNTGGYISAPREDWIFYSDFEKMPGFTEMFTKKKK